jgi:hypothetical protein
MAHQEKIETIRLYYHVARSRNYGQNVPTSTIRARLTPMLVLQSGLLVDLEGQTSRSSEIPYPGSEGQLEPTSG